MDNLSPSAKYSDKIQRLVAQHILDDIYGVKATNPTHNGINKHNELIAELKFTNEMKKMARKGGLELLPAQIRRYWNLLRSSISEQRELDTQANFQRTGPGTQWTNQKLKEFASEMKTYRNDFLEVGLPHVPLALWSGGIDVSEYANTLGYTTMESTKIGKVFTNAKLFHHDSSFNKVWNYMAIKFVEHARGCGGVHVFVRNFDQSSVLLKVEYVRLLKFRQEMAIPFKICWHVLVGDKIDEMMAIDPENPELIHKETKDNQYFFEDDGLTDYQVSPEQKAQAMLNKAEIAQRAYLMNNYRNMDDKIRLQIVDKFKQKPVVSEENRQRILKSNLGKGKSGW